MTNFVKADRSGAGPNKFFNNFLQKLWEYLLHWMKLHIGIAEWWRFIYSNLANQRFLIKICTLFRFVNNKWKGSVIAFRYWSAFWYWVKHGGGSKCVPRKVWQAFFSGPIQEFVNGAITIPAHIKLIIAYYHVLNIYPKPLLQFILKAPL